MLEITFLIVTALIILLIIHYQSKKAEPFQDDFYLQACPSGYSTLFYDENDFLWIYDLGSFSIRSKSNL